MAYLFIITRTFWAPAIFHFTNNLLAISIDFVGYRSDVINRATAFLELENAQSVIAAIATIVIGVILLIIALRLFTKITINRKEKTEARAFAEVAEEIKINYPATLNEGKNILTGAISRMNIVLIYCDRENGAIIEAPVPKEKLSIGFWGALGLVALIWISNLALG
ncbi:MAG: hypothetical protein EOM87_06165 [Clostridia bacterium]|nr:hypothetical protein [Clostridia bacterium]